jgi:hypothetical protein
MQILRGASPAPSFSVFRVCLKLPRAFALMDLWTSPARAGLSPSGCVDSPWTTLRVAHRLPTRSGLSPTGSTGPIIELFKFA